MEKIKSRMPGPKILVRAVVCLAIVGLGLGAMAYFASLKKKPNRAAPKEMVLQVTVSPALPETVETKLKGFGVVRPLTVVRLAAEVGGKLVYVHPSFSTGKTIERGEVIFRIDPSDYQAALDSLTALLAQKEAVLTRIRTELAQDQVRLPLKARTMELARAEFDRVRILLEENQIGNRSAVDQAEQAMNAAMDSYQQMKRALALYPVQIQEAQGAVASVRAEMEKARKSLDRCTVSAPFSGRIKSRGLELGEFAAPGKEVVTLADDSKLEILVSLDAREVSSWLGFEAGRELEAGFPRPLPVPCTVQWTEVRDQTWTGQVERLVAFDEASRTMTLAVIVDPSGQNCQDCPALVEGMFCAVTIPGKPLDGLFRVKRWLLTTDNTLYVAEKGRLSTRKVSRVYAEDDWVFVQGELVQGDLIITTRLVDPLEQSALNILSGSGD